MRARCPHPAGPVHSGAIGAAATARPAHDRRMPLPPLAPAVVVLAAVAGATVGATAGAVSRWWLARLARGARIGRPWCEAGVGLLWAAVAAAWAGGLVPGAAVGLLLGLGWLAVTGSAVDVAVLRLPDALTLPAVPAVLALLVPLGGAAVLRGAAGAVVLGAVHAGVRRCVPSAMGGGDVKLAAGVGTALAGTSWLALPVGAALTAVVSAAVAGAAVALGRAGRDGALPHGPALLGAAWTVTAAGAVVP